MTMQLKDLKPGGYYIPVFEKIEGEGFNTNSPIYIYLGDGEFATEDMNSVDCFYDPELCLYVACDAADGFVQ